MYILNNFQIVQFFYSIVSTMFLFAQNGGSFVHSKILYILHIDNGQKPATFRQYCYNAIANNF